MDIQGNTVARVSLRDGVPITELSWNCERFNMEEQTDRSQSENNQNDSYQNKSQFRNSEYGATPLYTTSSRRLPKNENGNEPNLKF